MRRSHYWFGIAFVVAIAGLSNGVGIVPPDHYRRLAENPYTIRSDIAPDNYWQESVLLPVLANLAGLTLPHQFYGLCLLAILLGALYLAGRLRDPSDPGLSLALFTLMAFSPLTIVMLSWLGMPDCITFILTAVALFTRSAPVLFAVCLLGALNHPAILFGVAGVMALRAGSGENAVGRRHYLACIAGFTLGTLGVKLFHLAFGIEAMSRLDFVLMRPPGEWLQMNASHVGMRIFSLLGCLWPPLAIATVMLYRRDRRYALALVMLMLAYAVITFFTEDTTRVFILMAWGAALHALVRYARTVEAKQLRQARLVLLLSAAFSPLYPRCYAWRDSIVPAPRNGLRMVERAARELPISPSGR
ncbi:MAG TPA: hypothetical protein GX715_08030 [Armatimonadetes bacterium]|nr:hypothetical protein [Armatimonadota bacterium]HPU00203.1 hypothetical protein [Armatimonadota bacterium]